MKIGFLGAGAVGGYFGGLMAKAGQDVGFVARGETLQKLQDEGLTLTDPEDTVHRIPVTAAADFAELKDKLGGLDVVVVATKALPDNETFPDVQGVPVVTTHNSVEIPYLAAERFGRESVIPGVIRGYLTHTGPAAVKLYPGPLSLNVGAFPMEGSEDSHAAAIGRELVDHLHAAGIGGEYYEDIFRDVWSKAMFVTTTGELGALANQPLGYVRGQMRSSLRALMEEVETVGRAHGVNLPEDIVDKTLAFADAQIPSATSSMQRDILAGLPNELDAQVGAIRHMGERAGVPTPLHDLVYGAIEGNLAARNS
ncbi:2-dehydropantoate 2-reductase [Corynebacterium anserum]|uniref:2-dehydropantoate 2-reductase n=1 Tax=Corynebacterium anserum TaxID=2684406 RepID=A0A7G7YMT8_9CORY|nr:2-dehydropantoate 2-reductase [Corynebacterium anserum]MBC2681186.1 2-dehydropantoate 2-reductase [Corynebacterium anserum]QNH95808.1 2-dehydropantoate 2-reductase [Corynebacterium anserum]